MTPPPKSSTGPAVRPAAAGCPACRGLGWQRLPAEPGQDGFGRLVACEACGRSSRARWLALVSRLSPEMQHWRLDRLEGRPRLRPVLARFRPALERRAGWITLSGPPGTGKTSLLAAAANEARLAGRLAVYTTVADLLADLRDTFDPDGDRGFSSLFRSVLDAPLLCLDEVEKFRATPWAEEQFFRLVEHRYRTWEQGLTLLATNRRVDPRQPLLPETAFPGYLESRIRDGRFLVLDDFWRFSDARPALRA